MKYGFHIDYGFHTSEVKVTDRIACSSFHAAVELIGKRWNGVIIDALLTGAQRFSELRGAIPEITPAMLSQRLKELEGQQLVRREVSTARPVEVTYSLTAVGRRLSVVLDAVAEWSLDWSGEEGKGTLWNSASTHLAS